MAERAPLPPELISLVHYIELNKQGWWDKAVQQLITSTIWIKDRRLSQREIQKAIKKEYGISLDSNKCEEQIGALVDSKILLISDNNQYKISEQSLKDFRLKLGEATKNEDAVKRKFIGIIEDCCPFITPEAAWSALVHELIIPMVKEMGARTYQLFSGSTDSIQSSQQFVKFLGKHQGQHKEALTNAVITFWDPTDPEIKSFIYRQLIAYFLVEASRLSKKTISTLLDMQKTKPTFTIFVDTNFLFSILGIHDNPSNESAESLMELISNISDEVDVELCVSSITLDEARNTIAHWMNKLADIDMPSNIAEIAAESDVGGIAQRFIEVNVEADQPIDARSYFKPYIENLALSLENKGLKIWDENLDSLKYDSRVTQDALTQEDYEKRRHGPRAKPYPQLEHDYSGPSCLGHGLTVIL